MYKVRIPYKGGLSINNSLEGETIEKKIERIMSNKEAIKDGAPLVYTERNKGVEAQYNIRTDRFEIAIEAMDVVSKSVQAKREQKAEMQIVKDAEGKPSTGTNLENN